MADIKRYWLISNAIGWYWTLLTDIKRYWLIINSIIDWYFRMCNYAISRLAPKHNTRPFIETQLYYTGCPIRYIHYTGCPSIQGCQIYRGSKWKCLPLLSFFYRIHTFLTGWQKSQKKNPYKFTPSFNIRGTLWPNKHNRVVLDPFKKWLVKCTLLYTRTREKSPLTRYQNYMAM